MKAGDMDQNRNPKEELPPLKIALICTPRAGNNWFRAMLAKALHLSTVAVHRVKGGQWGDFPPRTLLAIHWMPEPSFVQNLNNHGFKVFTIFRHPLDVLVSILSFSLFEKGTENWLLGQGGNEQGIIGAVPTSMAFLDYCNSDRANQLLSISPAWAEIPGTRVCRYEHLVNDPKKELARVCEGLLGDDVDLGLIAEEHSLENMRKKVPEARVNHHFWRGKADGWREFLPEKVARMASQNIEDIFAKTGYLVDPDPELSLPRAERNWLDIMGAQLSERLQEFRVLKKEHSELLESYQILKNQIQEMVSNPGNLQGFPFESPEIQIRNVPLRTLFWESFSRIKRKIVNL